MSNDAGDFAEGWVVVGQGRVPVERALGALGMDAFVLAPPRGAVRVWPAAADAEALREGAARLSAALPGARVLAFRTSGAALEVAVARDGALAAREEVAARLKQATQLARAHAALQRVAAALGHAGRLPALLRDGPARPAFLALAGVPDADVAHLHHGLLAGARARGPGGPDAARLAPVRHVPAGGGAPTALFASAPAAAAAAGPGLADARDTRGFLDAVRALEPARVDAATHAALEAVLDAPPAWAADAPARALVRAAAADALAAVAHAQREGARALSARTAARLREGGEGEALAAWARLARALPPAPALHDALGVALLREEAPEVLAALGHALVRRGAPGALPDAPLLALCQSPRLHERRAGYALALETESTAVVVALSARLGAELEADGPARALLARVVERLTGP